MLKTDFYTQNPFVRQIIALAYTALLTVTLLQSSSNPYIGQAAPPGPPDPTREFLLTMAHIIGFSLLVTLWWKAFFPSPRALPMAVIIALALGVVTELLQNFVPDRSASIFDLATNIVVTIGTAALITIYQRRTMYQ